MSSTTSPRESDRFVDSDPDAAWVDEMLKQEEPPLGDLIEDALSGLAWFSRPFADAGRLRSAGDDELLQLAGIVADQANVVRAQQALVTDAVDRATSPKLGGPRFVRDDEMERAERIERDPRTAEQYASDVLVELLRLGHAADPLLLGGDEPPAVRVLVTRDDLATRRGIALVEGQTSPVSVATAERHVCSAGEQEITFDLQGRPLDVGRASRLFTRRQRRALSARDGGCMFPGCERPPSWTEAHHIRHWVRDRGRSDIDDGILLCRYHHRLVHEQGWEFRHRLHEEGMRYELIPPTSIDAAQAARVLPSRSAAYRRLRARTVRAATVGRPQAGASP